VTIAKINYLEEIEIETGRVHNGWAGGVRYDMRRVSTRKIDPVIVECAELPVSLHVGWGDRDDAEQLPVWTDSDASGIEMESNKDGCKAYLRQDAFARYPTDEPMWADAFRAAVARIRIAAAEAEATRPEVAAACESYRGIVREIAREHEQHYAQWSLDVQRIARKFRRARVQVGEQTVPGKCCVRSSRGKLLGYANVWDGRWLGTVERLAA
jgi:hypothetical protein